VEFHVGMGSAGPNATDDREFCRSHGILYQSFSPLCGPCGTDELVTGDFVTSIGKHYGKTGAQVSLRWQVQQGIPVIPKTANPAHMEENADLFSWSLSNDDMATLTHATSPPVTGGGDGLTSGDCKIL
ncbi:NAD(P)H-dependent 6'-deoxychalcone synthase, partial [Durusdinium trenchii]